MDVKLSQFLFLICAYFVTCINAREILVKDDIDLPQNISTNTYIEITKQPDFLPFFPNFSNRPILPDLFLKEQEPVSLVGNTTLETLVNILRSRLRLADEPILAREVAKFDTDIHRQLMEVQIRSCPSIKLCQDNNVTFVSDERNYFKSCCDACNCDLEVCIETNSCCLDIVLDPSVNFPHQPESSRSCIPTGTGEKRSSIHRQFVYAVSKCPRHSNESDYASLSKCEDAYNADGVEDVIDMILCFDRWTRIIFRNRHCAYCHGVLDGDLEYFNTTITCNSLFDGSMYDDGDIIHNIFNEKHCYITAIQDPEFEKYSCKGFVNSCNQTGHWRIYNADIEAACLAYTSVYSLNSNSEHSRFKNIFCYICNGYDPNELRDVCFKTEQSMSDYSMTYSFSGLLNVKRPNTMPNAHLKQIPTDVNISCSISRNLVGEKCVPKFTTLQSVLVLLNLRTIPKQRLHMKISELGSMLFKLYDDLKDWFPPGFENEYCSRGASAELHASAETKLSSDSYVDVIYIDYNIPLFISQPFEMDAFFNDFLDSFRNEKLDVYLDKNTFHAFRIYIIEPPDSLESHRTGLHNRLRSNFGEQPVSYNAPIVGIESTPIPDLNRNTTDTYNMHPYQITSLDKIDDSKVSIRLSYPLFDHFCFGFGFQSQVLEFMHLIDCPLVNISRSNSSWITLQNGSVKMEDGYEISSDRYYMSGPDSIAICLNSYKNYTAYLQQMSGQVLKYSPEVIVTITCIGLSILCLLMSLAAYIAFPKLRHSLPGRNSMTLVSTHFAAQVLYLLSSLGGFQSGSLTCKTFGIFAHFSWLLCLFWMNVCTFHMFRVLTRMTVVRSSSKWKRYFLYLSYAFSMSATFVGVNVVVSVVSDNGIGYGKHYCYIDTQEMVMCTFALPAALIIVSNFVMFVSVIIKIKRSPSVQKNVKNERNDLEIFVKLSTITGMTWIFGLINSVTEISFFSYLFIGLNASQGVFLFFAFICNRRVYSMLMNLVYGTPELSTTGNTMSTTAS